MPSFGPIDIDRDGDPDLVAVIGTGPLARELRLINDRGQFSPKLGVESQETAFASIAGIDPWYLEDGSRVDSVAFFRQTLGFKSIGSLTPIPDYVEQDGSGSFLLRLGSGIEANAILNGYRVSLFWLPRRGAPSRNRSSSAKAGSTAPFLTPGSAGRTA